MSTITAPQAQGDLFIRSWPADIAPGQRESDIAATTPVPVGGVTILTGRDGHAHHLNHAVGIGWYRYPGDRQTLGVLTVAEDATAVLEHVEHGESRIGPGAWIIRRQREQADEIRLVVD